MRAVNLLPEGSRPRRASGRFSGSAYAVVGGLALLLVMVVVYVFTTNDITSKQSDIDAAKAQTQEAQKRIGSFTAFSDFAQITTARQATVRDLATVRFDWERLMREVSRVIPSDIWLLDMNASSTPQNAASGSGASTPSAPGSAGASGSAAATAKPSLVVDGCAPSQSAVAGLMVRLRQMDRVDDVQLGESARQDAAASGGATDSASNSAGCPNNRFKFTVTVTFSPPTPGKDQAGAGSVPTALGGGS